MQQNDPLPEVTEEEEKEIHDSLDTFYRTGTNIGKLHLTDDCVWLSEDNSNDVIEKPSSVYPLGWCDICKWCVEYHWRKK